MRSPKALGAVVALAGLMGLAGIMAGCEVAADLPTRTPVKIDDPDTIGGTFPSELDDPDVTTPTTFRSKIVPKQAVDGAKKAYIRYSPLIEFAIHQATYSPRWPGATVSYRPGVHPLSTTQRDLLKKAVDRLNLAVGFKVFAMLPDNASADIPVTDSTDFPSSSVLGETTAKVVSRISETAISIDFSEEVRLRPGLSDNLFFKVALHELGHAAGLEHNPDGNTLMNRGTSLRTPADFAQSEKESLKLLYSLADTPLELPRQTQSVGTEPLIGWTLY